MSKICKKCGIEKHESEFYKDKAMKDGLFSSCKKCCKEYSVKYIKNHPESTKIIQKRYNIVHKKERKEYSKKRYEENPEKLKELGKISYQKNKKEILKKAKIYREEHPDKIREDRKKWNEENPDYHKEYRKIHHEELIKKGEKYRKENPNYNKEFGKKYRKENPEKNKESKKKWKINHPEQIKNNKRKRRNLEYNANGYHTERQWLEKKMYHGDKCYYCGIPESELKNKYKCKLWWKLTEDHRKALSKNGSDWISNIVPACVSCNSSKHNRPIILKSLEILHN
jgi:hypothetical protein